MMTQSRTLSAIETVIGTVSGVAIAQIILAMNGLDLSHAVTWNLEILTCTSAVRFAWRRAFARFG